MQMTELGPTEMESLELRSWSFLDQPIRRASERRATRFRVLARTYLQYMADQAVILIREKTLEEQSPEIPCLASLI